MAGVFGRRTMWKGCVLLTGQLIKYAWLRDLRYKHIQAIGSQIEYRCLMNGEEVLTWSMKPGQRTVSMFHVSA